ncbi:MAG: hypothetical protein ABII26_03660 [Pseudomonadota bacterium]
MQEAEKHQNKYVLRYTKETERKFFSYATVAMLIFYGLMKILGH